MVQSFFFLLLESTLWVVGGYDNHTGTETTEFLSFDQPSSHGVRLPFTIADHCMVSIPNGKVVILGQGRRNINTDVRVGLDNLLKGL